MGAAAAANQVLQRFGQAAGRSLIIVVAPEVMTTCASWYIRRLPFAAVAPSLDLLQR